ncbi:hypothetical protein M427DRAFT_475623 [Gonapodya prolifera JEL478]|uniref:Uncharacterized protein n=1 Tax=Gonapodya prolifera (strain JEL478) TaxID=1344416 RepID=A0A139A1F3_GONPJ|nr:hypothetical protein M427DRAFT_475623 [Gonapodya prolifera JEL478]|eukprot:KXS10564.1 hypothetical protein M427DRAFT_475623 [Gonapodya prolifera JEL478]
MYAMACTFNRSDMGPQGGINPEGEFYFGRVRRLLASCLEDGPTLTTLFTALCMATYCSGTGRPSSGWM